MQLQQKNESECIMGEIETRIREIKDELNVFDDAFLKYAFIVELSAYIEPNQPDLMTDTYLHHGCQSQVWIKYEIENSLFTMKATSDTLIIRGILYIMMQLYNGLTVKEIAGRKIDFLKECDLTEQFSGARVNGITGIADTIYAVCCNFLKTDETS